MKQRFSSGSLTQHRFYLLAVRVHLFEALPLSSQSAGCSHSVRANVQSVLSLLKRHQPHLCNRRVLSTEAENQETGSHKRSDASSPSPSSSAAGEEELSELLRALQEEMRLMSLWVQPQQMGGAALHRVTVCLRPQGAGRVDETAGGQRFGRGEGRSSEGAGEAAG